MQPTVASGADRFQRRTAISVVASFRALASMVLLAVLATACTASVELERGAGVSPDTGDTIIDADAADADADADAGLVEVGSGEAGGDAGPVEGDGVDDGAAPSDEQQDDQHGDEPQEVAVAEIADAGRDQIAATYAAIVDDIVFVEAGEASGTGFVIDGGWVLTNAHVVERLSEVRLGGADGRDLGKWPVHAVDWLFDLALIGPVEGVSSGFARVPTDSLEPGDGVMLVGFPDVTSLDPTPTVTSGILSRRRATAVGNHTFFQVDATIAPGQSGGALVDVDGDLLGVSTLEFGAGEFGVALDADTMWRRVDQLVELGPMSPLTDGPSSFRLADDVGPLRNFGFIIEVGDGDDPTLLASSDDDIYIDVRDLAGFTLVEFEEREDPFVLPETADGISWFIDDLFEGGEELPPGLPVGTYEVVIGSYGEAPVDVELTSNVALRPFADVEEGAELPVGEVVEGVIDWIGDSDRWQLTLTEGDEVTLTSDGIADTVVAVRFDGDVVAAADDDSIGLFGTAATLSFVAPTSGVYEVEIGTFDDLRWGYLIEVSIS